VILGLGLDLVAVPGFRAQLADPATTFREGTFTARERADAERRASGDPSLHLAVRFAAKEAFLKAWSSAAFGRAPTLPHVDLREIEIVSDPYGRPALVLHGAVAAGVAAHGEVRIHVSLTHDEPTCGAVVVLESLR
jgi:holo-[acyl-carrier protein] synthase